MRIVMMGTGLFAEPTFEALLAGRHEVAGLVTQPDRVAGEERGSTRQVGRGMKQIALDHGLRVFQPENVNSPEGVAGLEEFRPDLLVVAAYGQILSKEVLAAAGEGGINVHASLLPKYRGAAPVAWAIYNGETETGVTIIRMSVRLDAGDMVAQETTAILPDETSGELEARLAQLGSRLALQVVDQISTGAARAIPQDKSQATKAPKLTKAHGAIDWSRPAAAVRNQIRAMQPWPTAYTFLRRPGATAVRLIIYRARVQPVPAPESAVPGEIITATGEDSRLLVVAGSQSILEIEELQPPGKRRMAAADYLRGHRMQPGDRLGPEEA